MTRHARRHRHALTGRQRKKLARREEIASFARLMALVRTGEHQQYDLMARIEAAVSVSGDDVERSSAVYGAVRNEIDGSPRKPFDAANVLKEPPCRFNEDLLEPFLLRVSERVSRGRPSVAFGTKSHFSSSDYADWDTFVQGVLGGTLRSLIAAIMIASR